MALRFIGGNPYYYRSVRRGDRVRSVLVASGELAHLVADREAGRRAELAEEREAARAERLADEERSRPLRELSRAVDEALGRALVAAGCHRPKRGEWRRRRGAMSGIIRPATGTTATPAPLPEEEARGVLDRWEAGDRTITADEADAMLGACPDLVGVFGSPANLCLMNLVAHHCGDDPLRRAATMRQVERVERDLAGPGASPTERLLAQRAALVWLELHFVQAACATRKDAPTPTQAAQRERRLDALNRRFNAAVRTLATVRKLGLPDLHLIDARSVHVTNNASAAAPGPMIQVPPE